MRDSERLHPMGISRALDALDLKEVAYRRTRLKNTRNDTIRTTIKRANREALARMKELRAIIGEDGYRLPG